MRIPDTLRWLCGAIFLLAASAIPAQTCTPSIPFQYESQNQAQATWTAATPTDPCALTVALNADAGASAAAFVHYQRASPLTLARYGFRIDTSALTGMTLANRGVWLFTASSPTPVTPAVGGLVLLTLRGASTAPALTLAAACSCGAVLDRIDMPPGVHTVRLEIATGAGAAGAVRLWLDHAFTDAPDRVLDQAGAGLDNAAGQGVIAAEIGLSTASPAFRTDYAGANVTFDQFESNDDTLFFSDFTGGGQ